METTMQEMMYGKLLDLLFAQKAIAIPTDFSEQNRQIQLMLANDTTGVINTILKYAIDSASQTNYRIECPNQNVEDLINSWMKNVNLNINGQIPSGLKALSIEYFKERWTGSSLCLLRAVAWTEQDLGGTKITIPSALYFVNGASVKIDIPKNKDGKEVSFSLGSYKYYLDTISKKTEIPSNEQEIIIIRKPFSRWFDKYPTPYSIKQGILKNYKAIEILQNKGDEVVTKILPYLFILKKGTEALYLSGTKYTEKDLEEMGRNWKKKLKEYSKNIGETPIANIPFDTEMNHLIPDLIKVLNQELYNQGYRALLAGLGFIDVVQGLASTRKESVLNPAPFIEEVNSGVGDFKSILFDLVQMIILKNKETHPKLFGENNELKVVNSPLKINVERIQDILRSGYDRGAVSITTYQEILGVDSDVEKERREYEAKEGLDEIFYPHLIQNQEEKGIDAPGLKPAKPKETKKEDKKSGTPEVLNYKKAEIDLIIAPYDKNNPPAFLKKYPKGAIDIFIDVFNENLPKGEDYAFPVAYTAMKRWLKKHGYKKINDKWVKSEEINNE